MTILSAPGAGPAKPFVFIADGREFVCAWHKGFDRSHPLNETASHSACPDCLVRMFAEPVESTTATVNA